MNGTTSDKYGILIVSYIYVSEGPVVRDAKDETDALPPATKYEWQVAMRRKGRVHHDVYL